MALERLQKLLAAAGCGSRRLCETFITDGRVSVDGKIVTELGTRVDADTAELRLDGELVRANMARRTWLLNKPKGVICSQRGRPDMPMVGDFAPPEARGQRLFTVGRLDVESEGAILLTNDGELCHRVTHPRFGVEKTYRVNVEGVPDDETLERMRKGVWLAEGRTSPIQVLCLQRLSDRSVLEIKVREGMKREIRRICARFGHEVHRLVRVAIGPVQLGRLPRGACRPLTPAEEAGLRDCADVIIKLGSRTPVRQGTADSRRSRAKDHELNPENAGGSTRGRSGIGGRRPTPRRNEGESTGRSRGASGRPESGGADRGRTGGTGRSGGGGSGGGSGRSGGGGGRSGGSGRSGGTGSGRSGSGGGRSGGGRGRS